MKWIRIAEFGLYIPKKQRHYNKQIVGKVMITKIDWPKLRETLHPHQKVFLDYISRLTACVESYKNGEINVDTAIKKEAEILSDEIDDPEFYNFAIENFRELFGYIATGRINIRIHRDVTGEMWFGVG